MAIILFAMAILLKPVLPVLEYAVNYDYIANELCINKDNKNLHCNGKCHLKTKLAEAADSTDKNLPDKKPKTSQSEVLFFTPIAELTFRVPAAIDDKIADRYSDSYRYQRCNRFFHPPSIA